MKLLCPNGHECRPATAPTCMVGSGYYWCGRCISEPRYIAMSGTWAKGMFWPRDRLAAERAMLEDEIA